MSFNRIFTIFLRQMFLFRRSGYRFFGLFYWSTLDLLLWGALTIYLNRIGGSDFGFISILLGSVILLNFFTRVQHGISISYLEDVWVRNFINLFSSPLSIREYIFGLMLTSAATTTVSMLFMLVLAWLLFVYNIFQLGFVMIPFIAILFIFGWALGIFTTSIILRFGPSSEILAWSIPAILTPLAGVFYPISTLPEFLQPLARALPISHVFESMRSIVLYGTFEVKSIWFAFGLSVAFLIFAYVFLLRTYRYVLAQGHFIKFFSE